MKTITLPIEVLGVDKPEHGGSVYCIPVRLGEQGGTRYHSFCILAERGDETGNLVLMTGEGDEEIADVNLKELGINLDNLPSIS
jgi:hypothetical protein